MIWIAFLHTRRCLVPAEYAVTLLRDRSMRDGRYLAECHI